MEIAVVIPTKISKDETNLYKQIANTIPSVKKPDRRFFQAEELF